MSRLQGKVCLITGASSGIGRATAIRFSQEGASCIIVGRNKENLAATNLEMASPAYALPLDLSLDEDITTLSQAIKEKFGKIDVIVNVAGTVIRNENMIDTSKEEWDEHIAMNLRSPFLICKQLLPLMIPQGSGSIINISSQLALVSAPGYSTYSTAKGGILSFTRSLAIDYGIHGIRANCISPGLVETPMAHVGRPDFDESKQTIAKSLPLGRIGKPKDIAHAALFLASDESSWITGTNLVVDGGYTAK